MEEKNTRRLNIVIDGDLQRELKIEVAKEDTTISKFVSEAISEKLIRKKKEIK